MVLIPQKTIGNQKYLIFTILYIFSFYMQSIYFDVGFALKLFMIITIFYFFIHLNRIRLYINNHDYFILFFFIYSFTTVPLSIDIINGFRLIIGSIIIVFVYFVLKYHFIKVNYNLEKTFVIVGFLFALTSIILYFYGLFLIEGKFLIYESEKVFGVMVDRGIPRLIGITKDPNFYAFYSFLFLFLLFYKRKTVFEYFTFYLLLLTLILTVSRAGLLAFIVVFLSIYLIAFLKGIFTLKIKRLNFFRVLFMLMLYIVIFYLVMNNEFLISIIEKRLDSAGGGSGRFEIWLVGLELWMQNIFTGIGYYNFLYYNVNLYGGSHYMHNTFLEVLVETGLIGFVFYLLFHIVVIVNIYKLSKYNKYQYILPTYLTMLIMMLSLSTIINEVFFLILALISSLIHEERNNAILRDKYA